MRNRDNHRVILLFLCAFWLISGALSAYAQAPDVRPGCDPEYMDAVEARSWLMGQRRISQNKNLILKPDSVIEYSCFNQFIGYLAAHPDARRFSENYPEPAFPTWTPAISGIDDQSLDSALFEVVTAPMIQYLDANFKHTFLGGREKEKQAKEPAYGQYNCETMQHVWSLARCMDFIEDDKGNYELGDDDFYDFPFYLSNDPRRLPKRFEACAAPNDLYVKAIEEAYRGKGQKGSPDNKYEHFVLEEENNPSIDDGVFYDFDPIQVQNILNFILPGECGKSAMIPTGIEIEIPDGNPEEFNETVCSMPSCSFDGESCVK